MAQYGGWCRKQRGGWLVMNQYMKCRAVSCLVILHLSSLTSAVDHLHWQPQQQQAAPRPRGLSPLLRTKPIAAGQKFIQFTSPRLTSPLLLVLHRPVVPPRATIAAARLNCLLLSPQIASARTRWSSGRLGLCPTTLLAMGTPPISRTTCSEYRRYFSPLSPVHAHLHRGPRQ